VQQCILFIIVRNVAPCSLVEVYRRFRGACCLHHQDDEGDDDSDYLGSKHHCNFFKLLPGYTAQHPRRQSYSYSLSENVKSHLQVCFCIYSTYETVHYTIGRRILILKLYTNLTLGSYSELAVEIKFMLTSNSVRTANKTHRFSIIETSWVSVYGNYYCISRSFPLTIHSRLHEERIIISLSFQRSVT
jgi:hypothetical protein